MENQITGDVEFNMGGKAYVLNFDWAALNSLKSKYNDDQLTEVLNGNMGDIQIIAEVLADGLKKHHKDITPADVIKASPPLVPTIQALDRALSIAYWGAEIDDPDFGKEQEPEKKTPQNRKARRTTAKKKTAKKKPAGATRKKK